MSTTSLGRAGVRRSVAVALLLVGLLAALVGDAGVAGATGSEHDGGTASCVARIDRRIKDVDKLIAKVGSAPDVTSSHRSTLTQALQEARDGLVTLRADIVALAPTVASYHEQEQSPPAELSPELQAACRRMYTDFRIYALRKAQVNLVIAADRVVGQRALFDLLGSELEAAIAAAGSDPDVAEAQQLLADYRARIDEAWGAASGVGDAVVGLGPDDWNSNPQVLGPYVDTMREVKRDLKTAKKDARQIVALLGGAPSDKPLVS
jgi:hypothetical protein